MSFYRKCCFVLFVLLIGTTACFAKIDPLERVEPAFWWVGMKNTHVQLIVHGQDIAQRTIHFSYAGVQLGTVHKVENPNYLFVDINITAAARSGKFVIHFSKEKQPDLVYSVCLVRLSRRSRR